MAKKIEPVMYGDRDSLDENLQSVLAEVKSAEEEAKRIIAQAEASVKAIQLDAANRERDMKERSKTVTAQAHDEAIAAAAARAQAEREKRVRAAEEQGERLIAEKQKAVAARTAELYAALGGDRQNVAPPTCRTSARPK